MQKRTRLIGAKRIYQIFLASLISLAYVLPTQAYAATSTGAGTQSSLITTTALTDTKNATTIAELSTAMQSFLNQYSLTFATDCDVGPYTPAQTCTALVDADIVDAKQLAIYMIEEYSKYPPAWVTSTDLTTIRFIDDYMVDGVHRANGPLNAMQAMIYDISDSIFEDYIRESIHHEIGHYIEFFQSGNTSYSVSDPTWSGYNVSGFTYGTGGASCYATPAPDYCTFTGVHPTGFVTAYSRSGIEEDKAEVYAYLFTTKYYADFQDWTSEDPGLLSKMNRYKGFISGINATMDESYFNSIHTYFAEDHAGTDFTTDSKTIELTDSQPTTTLEIFLNRIFVVNGVRGATNVQSGGTLKGTGTVGALSVQSGAHLAPGNSPGCLSAGNTTLTGNFDVEIGGTAACTGYDRLQVTGTVDVTGGVLNVSRFNGFTPAVGQTYTIITNDLADAITGTFTGLAQGASITIDGYTFTISYTGGDGNDVVLTVTGAPATTSAPGTPNTGLGLLMTNPIIILLATSSSALTMLFLARKYGVGKA